MSSLRSSDTERSITICGAGLAGSLMAILLAQLGCRVRVFERLPDMRRETIPAGRSINLALAARGIRVLERAGVMPQVQPHTIAMPGRMLHDVSGAQTFLPYGKDESEVNYSVSRAGLNHILLDAAEQAGVEILFKHPVVGADFARGTIRIRSEIDNREFEIEMHRVIGADGAGSVLRHALAKELSIENREDLLEHGYKELTIPPDEHGGWRIERHALHIWPRGGFMLIALPNTDGSFTATLFAPHEGANSFASLRSARDVREFFEREFPDVVPLLPNLEQEFMTHPTGIMGTVRCERWSLDDKLLLIGDAAHAITPFHGQGMNCAFEDCGQLATLLAGNEDFREVFAQFERLRRPNTDAIAQMALENYQEMRDTVRDPKFQLQKMLSLELERRFPDRFIPRYSMVMFHARIPYAVALERGRIQAEILAALTHDAAALEDIDWTHAARLIEERLEPIAT
ncbi:MAG TPA: NAD(P)/FAD-dependent oxidoreductase [Steroidobacteraceae bacterium]